MQKVILIALLILCSNVTYAEPLNSSLIPKAKNGDVCAQIELGSYYQSEGKHDYRSGSQQSENIAESIRWYKKAARSTCTESMCSMCQYEARTNLAYSAINEGTRVFNGCGFK